MCSTTAAQCLIGHPPVKAEVIEAIAPRAPGEKLGFLRGIKFVWTLLFHIFGIIGSRAAVVDPRAEAVLSLSLHDPAD